MQFLRRQTLRCLQRNKNVKGFAMKRLIVFAAIGSLALTAALPAKAGPDFDAIAHGRKLRDADALASLRAQGAASPSSPRIKQDDPAAGPATPACQPEELMPQLDHGPQAQTTPFLNRQRIERRDAALQACRDRLPSTPAR
jgi:hypothetical protein